MLTKLKMTYSQGHASTYTDRLSNLCEKSINAQLRPYLGSRIVSISYEAIREQLFDLIMDTLKDNYGVVE